MAKSSGETVSQGRPTFSGKGPHPLWAGSRAARVKITISGVPDRLNYCVIVIVYIYIYIEFRKVAASWTPALYTIP
jgi:hypothetical protein